MQEIKNEELKIKNEKGTPTLPQTSDLDILNFLISNF
jgi:hypothetical protein